MAFANRENEDEAFFKSFSALSLRSDLLLRLGTSKKFTVIPKYQKISRNNFMFDLTKDPNMLSIGEVLSYEIVSNSRQMARSHNLLKHHQYLIGNKKFKKVCNPFIDSSFELTKHFKYPNTTPREYYHATKKIYVDSICTNNFDWRFSGSERGHKHGWGVNFTNDLDFARNFCDQKYTKVAIIAEVLVKNKICGNPNMRVAPRGYDTATGRGKVFVKFSDAEFCPRYVIYFH